MIHLNGEAGGMVSPEHRDPEDQPQKLPPGHALVPLWLVEGSAWVTQYSLLPLGIPLAKYRPNTCVRVQGHQLCWVQVGQHSSGAECFLELLKCTSSDHTNFALSPSAV